MNSKKFSAVGFLILSGLVTLVQFQNCAKPQQMGSSSQLNSADSDSRNVDTIDPIYKGTLTFDKPYVELSEIPVNRIEGTCDSSQEGSQLSWQLLETEDSIIEMGEARCASARFDVKIDFVKEFPCNKEIILRAYLGAKARDESIVIRKCLAQN